MAANWMRRSFLAAACASAALLAACGSSTTESALKPERFIAFGDAFTDVGQTGTRYTVNNGSVNNWTLQLASRYGKTLAPAATGGLSYAQGNARITAQPDAAGQSAPSVKEQIDGFLAGQGFAANDLVLINGGMSDLIVGMAAVQAGTLSTADFLTQARENGDAMAKQVRRLVAAGAKHVVVSGVYDLSKTPWATGMKQETLLANASLRFNEGLLIGINDLGENVLYVDAAYYVNLYTYSPGTYYFSNATVPVCTSVDAANGIGIGAGEVNSSKCSGTTLLSGANPDEYVFADKVYMTPSAHRQFGNYAYDRLRMRW